MKKTFLTSVAAAALMVASGAVTGAAQAEDKAVELELGGYFVGSVSVSDNDLSNITGALIDPDAYEFIGESRVRFEGVSVLDSGLRYGFQAQVNVQKDMHPRTPEEGPLDMIDEAYLYLDGGFGRVEIGQQDGVADQFSVRSPHALPRMSAGDSRSEDMVDPLALSVIGTTNDSSEDFAKITYMTPSFGGLKLGLSFTPDREQSPQPLGVVESEVGEDIVEFGVIYSRNFEDLSLDMSATYVAADATPVVGDLEEWNAGVNVGFRGLSVGGSYRESESLDVSLQKYEAYDIGVAYETGGWKVSAQYAEHEGALAGAPFENGYRYLISARYKVAKGLSLGAGFQRDLDTLTEEEGSAFILESALKF